MDRRTWWARVHGVAKGRTRLSTHTAHGRDTRNYISKSIDIHWIGQNVRSCLFVCLFFGNILRESPNEPFGLLSVL